MGVLWFDGMLAQSADAGVYFLPEDDVDELLEAAAVVRFPCLRINLRDCAGSEDLKLRLSGALAVPPGLVREWSELAAALARLRHDDTPGQVLLLEHSEGVRAQARDEFKRAMEALQAASSQWAERGLPLWSFIVLDEAEFDALG
jgi:hypothetical protein